MYKYVFSGTEGFFGEYLQKRCCQTIAIVYGDKKVDDSNKTLPEQNINNS